MVHTVAPHPVNHPVSSDARAPQAAGSESDEGSLLWKEVDEEARRRQLADEFAKDSIGRKLLKGDEGQVVGYLSESQSGEIKGRSSEEQLAELVVGYLEQITEWRDQKIFRRRSASTGPVIR